MRKEFFKPNIRLIGRLDIKGPNLIKSINLEGIRVIGKPEEFALSYYQQGIDELICMDMVASLYGRNNLKDVVSFIANNIFVPLTVGGGESAA
jgi:cyclase